MDAQIFLIQLVVILISARLLGELAAYFKIPPVIGELLAGIILGPSLFGWIEPTHSIQLLAEIGVILLLFEVGQETDISRLVSAGTKALVVALVGVLAPFLLGYLISSSLFGLSTLQSFFIGSTLTATSIGITLRVLRDLKKQNSHEAQIILGAAVIDDIIGIILLAMLYEFATSGGVDYVNSAKAFLYIVLFFILSPIAAKAISFLIQRWEKKSEIPGLLPSSIVALILFFAWLSHEMGAPALLGGFAAGLALSSQFFPTKEQKQFSHQVEESMKPIIHLFSPIFFVTIGLSLNLKTIDWGSSFIWGLTGLLLLAAIFGKWIAGYFLWKEPLITKTIIGTAMVPRGEVGLIFANIGLTTAIIKEDIYASLILVIAVTTLLAPLCLRYLYGTEKPETS